MLHRYMFLTIVLLTGLMSVGVVFANDSQLVESEASESIAHVEDFQSETSPEMAIGSDLELATSVTPTAEGLALVEALQSSADSQAAFAALSAEEQALVVATMSFNPLANANSPILAAVTGRAYFTSGSYFSLAAWDSKMYVDVYAVCDGGATIIVTRGGQYVQQFYSGPLNGSRWRVFLTAMKPRISYRVDVFCGAYASSDVGVTRSYNVYYSGATIKASRIA